MNIGFQASRKKQMIKDGQLDKYGRKNEKTPKDWLSSYVDYKGSVGFLAHGYKVI